MASKYGGIPKAMAAKKLNCKVSELLDRNAAAKELGIEPFRTGHILREGRLVGYKVRHTHLKHGKWVTSRAACIAYKNSKGKRQDGMTTVLVRMPYDKAIEFAKANDNAELRYNRKKK